jgi:hypothetical protein
MKIKQTVLCATFLAAFSLPASAVITWTGAIDTDLTNDGNWDFSGSSLTTVAGITDATLAEDLSFTGAGSTPTLANLNGQPAWGVVAGNTMMFDGATLANSGNDGIGLGTIELANGSSVTAFFARKTISVDATSHLILEGAGDPLPGTSTVTLVPGATLTMASVAEFTEQGSQIYVNGQSYDLDNSILTFSGTTATAVPESSTSAIILGVVGLALVMRRRK